MPNSLWEELNKRPRMIPLPTPDTEWNSRSNDGAVKYLDYHAVKYIQTIPSHRPSYKPPSTAKAMESLDKILSDTTRPSHMSKRSSLWHKGRVRHFVVCENCDKRRVIFAWPMSGVNIAERVPALNGVLSEPSYDYNCGDALFGLEDEPVCHPPDLSIFHVRRNLSCAMPQEVLYYSCAKFETICAHCGCEDDHVPTQELQALTEGRKAYSICRNCLDENKKPLVYGQKQKTGDNTKSRKRAQKTDQGPASSKKKKDKTSPIPSWASSSKQLKAPLGGAAATTKSGNPLRTHSAPAKESSSHKEDPRNWILGEYRRSFEHKEEMQKFGLMQDVLGNGNCGF
jgi:hypothetical protein